MQLINLVRIVFHEGIA